MADLLIQRPWLIVFSMILGMLVIEEISGTHTSKQYPSRRISDNFLLYSLGFAFVGLIGAVVPDLSGNEGQALVPRFGLSAWFAMPQWAILLALFLIESLANYWIHRWSHTVPFIWRFHRVHHSDRTQDASSALRNHPLEVIPTLFNQIAAAAIVGATPIQALLVSLINLFWALLTHADLGRRPFRFPAALSFLVSPATHRIHHSSLAAQTDSNYGNMLTIWDQLFGTYREPARETVAEIGLGADYADTHSFVGQLALPFRSNGSTSASQSAASAKPAPNAELVRPPVHRLTRPHPEAASEAGEPVGL